jgi:hypothetical protein
MRIPVAVLLGLLSVVTAFQSLKPRGVTSTLRMALIDYKTELAQTAANIAGKGKYTSS